MIIDYQGFEFEIIGFFEVYSKGSFKEPPSGGFEIQDILLNGVSIYDLLNEDTISGIEYEANRQTEQEYYGY
jgi:hypothetical protein